MYDRKKFPILSYSNRFSANVVNTNETLRTKRTTFFDPISSSYRRHMSENAHVYIDIL